MSRAGANANRARETRITVVTPTIPGREAMLAEAVASVEAQTLPAVAHLIELDDQYVGPGPTLNRLIPQANTEWVSILADDDLYRPRHLETLAAHSAKADIVLSWSKMDQPQYRGPFTKQRILDRQDSGMRGCFMFRKSLYDELGGWPECHLEDWTFLVKAIEHGARFVPVYKETWEYRMHDGSTSRLIERIQRGEQVENTYHLLKT